MGTDFDVVGDLHQVVELHAAADVGAAHRGAVNAGVGTNFDPILDGDDADLRNLFVAVGRRGETKSVGADDASAVENHFVADAATVVDAHAGIEEAILAHCGSLLDDAMGVNLCACTYADARADIGKGTDVDFFAERGIGFHTGQGVDAGALLGHGFVERKQTRDGLIGIVDAHQSGRNGSFGHKIAIDEHDGRSRFVEMMGILGIGQEGECSGLPFFDFGKGIDGGFGVTFDRSAEIGGNLLRCKFHGQ